MLEALTQGNARTAGKRTVEERLQVHVQVGGVRHVFLKHVQLLFPFCGVSMDAVGNEQQAEHRKSDATSTFEHHFE